MSADIHRAHRPEGNVLRADRSFLAETSNPAQFARRIELGHEEVAVAFGEEGRVGDREVAGKGSAKVDSADFIGGDVAEREGGAAANAHCQTDLPSFGQPKKKDRLAAIRIGKGHVCQMYRVPVDAGPEYAFTGSRGQTGRFIGKFTACAYGPRYFAVCGKTCEIDVFLSISLQSGSGEVEPRSIISAAQPHRAVGRCDQRGGRLVTLRTPVLDPSPVLRRQGHNTQAENKGEGGEQPVDGVHCFHRPVLSYNKGTPLSYIVVVEAAYFCPLSQTILTK